MYKVVLYFSFGAVFLTKNRRPDGEQLLYDSLALAENAGRATGVPFEAVKM